jgi:hypothetical protein
MKKKKQDAIDEIMDNFDFEKVAKVMEVLGWKWVNSETDLKIPDVSELRKQARRLLTTALKENTGVATGGFKVTYLKDEKFLHLEFVVSEWDTQF